MEVVEWGVFVLSGGEGRAALEERGGGRGSRGSRFGGGGGGAFFANGMGFSGGESTD